MTWTGDKGRVSMDRGRYFAASKALTGQRESRYRSALDSVREDARSLMSRLQPDTFAHTAAERFVADYHDRFYASARAAAERFLADYDLIYPLSGAEFCQSAKSALERFDTQVLDASAALDESRYRQERECFDAWCRWMTAFLEFHRERDASAQPRHQSRSPYPKADRLAAKAAALLEDADRILRLTGDEFIREANAAQELITRRDLEAVKLEIYSTWLTTRPADWSRAIARRLKRSESS